MADGPSRLSVDEARSLVDQIAVGYGYISQGMLDAMPLEVRRVVEEALRKESKGPEPLNAFARKLRTSKARFIYELLQNADDNSYSRAKARSETPFISFRVFHDRVVVECNEDGFSEQDVNAICDVRKRSRGKQGYVGADQAGFKAVFTVAHRVDIESGPFSFHFLHREGDSGVGMVRPIWAGPRVIPNQQPPLQSSGEANSSGEVTRFTLHLRDGEWGGELAQLRDNIVAQLRGLPATVLLFMKSLRAIRVEVVGASGEALQSREMTIRRGTFSSPSRVREVERSDSVTTETCRWFYMFSHPAENLPANVNRSHRDPVAGKPPDSTAEVVLAFPVDSKDEPLMQSQSLFAFMPLKAAGFNFLIQSDFVAQDDGQDIAISSPRNVALRQAISSAFTEAVQKLSVHPYLYNKWMRYLPQSASPPPNPFWRELATSIQSAVRNTPCVQSNNNQFGTRYRISELHKLQDSLVDKDGNPLVPDLSAELYLSQAYVPDCVEILREYGLKDLSMWAFFPRIQAFVNGIDWHSKLFDSRDEDWHSRLARLVLRVWNDEHVLWRTVIKQMRILPLRSGEARQPPSDDTKIYFPDVDGVLIPEDVEMLMILPAAAANLDCRRLYRALGVGTADVPTVRKIITAKHCLTGVHALDLTMSDNHLRYLYRMHVRDPIEWEEQQKMVLFDHKNRPKVPKKDYVYLPGEGQWSPYNLLVSSVPAGVAEPDVSILHPKYLENPPSHPEGYDKSWLDWLYEVIWVENRIQLFSERDSVIDAVKEFSKEYLFVVENWPGKAVARFHTNFQKPEVQKIWEDDAIGTTLVRTKKFRCTDGFNHAMETTILPLQPIVAQCKRFLTNPHALPFLPVDEEVREEDRPSWAGFAKHFGILHTDELALSLRILEAIVHGKSTTNGPLTNAVVELYLHIVSQYESSEDKEASRNQIRAFFSKNPAILSTPRVLALLLPPRWVSPEQCLWDAPANSTSFVALRASWLGVLSTLPSEDKQKLETFFHYTLAVSNMSYHDVIRELQALSASRESQTSNQKTAGLTYELYRKLDNLRNQMTETELHDARSKFNKDPLIFTWHNSETRWLKVSQCCWVGEGAGAHDRSLQPLYPDLADLFLEYLKVPGISPRLALKSLMDNFGMEGSNDVAHAKRLLWSLNEYLTFDSTKECELVESLRLRPMFPIRFPGGNVELMTRVYGFSIADRQPYLDAFQDRAKLLDFSIEEVRRLNPLIDWAGLHDRYLSRLVTEKTSVHGAQGTKDAPLTRDLAGRAHAFASIASHFNPSGPVGHASFLYNICQIEAFRSSGIRTSLSLYQDFEELVVASGDSGLHIENDRNGQIRLYVPVDDELRDFSLSTKLPRELAAYLLGDTISDVPDEAVIVTASVLNGQLTSIGRILEASGIAWLHSSQHADAVPSSVSGNGAMQSEAHTPVVTSTQVIRPTLSVELANSPYEALLIQAANQARVAQMPREDSTFNMSTMSQALQTVSSRAPFRFYAGNQIDWQRMVGAAGELYVFELLLGIHPALPDFSPACWQSTVRHFASSHPQYSSLEPWIGKEQSDIFYDDISGALTAHLIMKGYLSEATRVRRPKYYIEVKSTMSSSFDAPFYMSKYQYARMQSFSNNAQSSQHQDQVYALFRVFGLESGNVGVKVYINPELARINGDLEFEAQSWTVTARR